MKTRVSNIDCFLANDVRGIVPDQLNESIAYDIGRAFGESLKARTVCIGYDVRDSSPSLARSIASGLFACGCNVYSLGLCGTEEVYFSVSELDLDGGIMVTASHNPQEYNGIKFVGRGSSPLNSQILNDIKLRAQNKEFSNPNTPGKDLGLVSPEAYISHILGYVNTEKLKPLNIVLDSGNGCAGPVLDFLEPSLPFSLIKIRNKPDGSFPHGIPNPLLPENREYTSIAVQKHNADFGVAFDGDFDRCFFFDEFGNFIEGYYLVALLARMCLRKEPKGTIIHDPRLIWNTIEQVNSLGARAVMSRTGHTFIKQRMRDENAVYGGEMSGHHYFRKFFYCDSGMVPWLLVAELLSTTGKTLSSFISDARSRYPVSGEINRKVTDMDEAILSVRKYFENDICEIDETDGISMNFTDWRFNLRSSNTESLLRLNVESRNDPEKLEQMVSTILKIVDNFCVH